MTLPVAVIFLACVCPLHAHVGDTRANHVCSAYVHQVAFELYRIIDFYAMSLIFWLKV